MSQSPFSVYVHVPFCAHKCPYCDFNTYAVARIPESEYVEALCVELASYRDDERFAGRPVCTVFFGGGTPSLFSEAAIERIVNCINDSFPILAQSEITLEANPNDAESSKLAGFKAAGINRVSFGVQSFDDQRLQQLGRNHSAEEAVRAIERAVDAGIVNVSLDLIFGLPEQSIQELESDLHRALALPIQHLSTYSLTIEPGTPFFQRQARGLLTMPTDERVALMLARIPEIASAAGFSRYEISNYSHPGAESAHNMVYWSGGDYLGVGAGAHSYCARYSQAGQLESAERWSTLALPQSYIEAVEPGRRISWRETLDPTALQFEFFYLGLRRTVQGVSRAEYERLFGESFSEGTTRSLQELAEEGFVAFDGDIVRLTADGVAVADSVFERLAR
jgi:putative oxygen-independent coproporphyrinogen III oxidase